MSRQRGVALITVLLVVALVSVVCTGLVLRQQLAIRSTGNQLLVRQAQYYAEGGELLAKAILQRDLREGDPRQPLDHLGEPWANPKLSFPLDEGGELRLRIVDLSGRFNLNSLANGSAIALERLRLLLQQLQIPVEYAERLQDWLDQDQENLGGNGAEDAQYLLLQPPYRTGPGLIREVSELRLLLGMKEAEYRRLLPFVCALPVEARLNVNTASAQVLASLNANASASALDGVVAMQQRGGYRDLAGFAQQLGMQDTAGLDIGSQYFQVISEASLGERRQVLVSYLQRGNDGRVRVLARDLGQSGIAPPEPSKESKQ
ncbi:type II secretion system minor pseudopilin GspK [Aquipseudomonas campi]|uniref:Type II secretion system protein K n=1 Tax=Aquipseudomonas campi TaxID=2731681 RepID=A0A6M8FHA5_9GAMM|nr:type II secretion system minor pseudopilin GspK [Pseudomonas campi]QKE63712.1 type II secretion system minor pseudopilin GspK [Pseudomonas campi]